MYISNNKAVSICYTLTNDGGDILDQTTKTDPFNYLHGANNIIAGLEHALTDKSVSDKFTITIPPDQAYGRRNDRLVETVPKTMFDGVPEEALIPGSEFNAQTDQGMEVITITKVNSDTVTIDANHPLAGENLHFDVEVLNVRDATKEELDHGHVHAHGDCGVEH